MKKTIDINCDLGEGIGNEAELMPWLSSCNIACGGHAGNLDAMEAVVSLAQAYGVKIGAHPSFPDRENFGRQVMNMSKEALYDALYSQIMSLNAILDHKNLKLHHIKPHGALYNLAAIDEVTASIVVDVIKRFGDHIFLYAPFNSVLSKVALKEGLQIKYEAFADRNYNSDLTLVSRRKDNALISKSEDMFRHVYKMISEEKVYTIDGVEAMLKADTICVHGDGQNAVENLTYLVQKLRQYNIEIL